MYLEGFWFLLEEFFWRLCFCMMKYFKFHNSCFALRLFFFCKWQGHGVTLHTPVVIQETFQHSSLKMEDPSRAIEWILWYSLIVSKIYQGINITRSISIFFHFVVYRNGNVSMHHIPSCIMSFCIMLYHQHKFYGTYVLCKEGWGTF